MTSIFVSNHRFYYIFNQQFQVNRIRKLFVQSLLSKLWIEFDGIRKIFKE